MYLFYYLIAQILLWSLEALSVGYCVFWLTVCVCVTSLLHGTTGCHRFILYTPFSDLKSAISSRDLVCLLKNGIRIDS